MAADVTAIRNAIRTKVQSASPTFAALVTAGKVQAENRVFSPPAQALWARETLGIVSEIRIATRLVEVLGRAAYDLQAPLGAGTEAVEALAQEIMDGIDPSTKLVLGNGQTVNLYRVERTPGLPFSEQWYAIRVIFSWRAFAHPAS